MCNAFKLRESWTGKGEKRREKLKDGRNGPFGGGKGVNPPSIRRGVREVSHVKGDGSVEPPLTGKKPLSKGKRQTNISKETKQPT